MELHEPRKCEELDEFSHFRAGAARVLEPFFLDKVALNLLEENSFLGFGD